MDWLISWGDGSEETHIPGGPRNRVELNHRFMAKGDYSIEITTTNILGEKSTVLMPVSVHDIVVTESRATDIAMEEFIESTEQK